MKTDKPSVTDRQSVDITSGEPKARCPLGSAVQGLIFDIQGHSIHDGPGTRTTVFMSGCPLSCIWCCNPEGLHRQPVVMYKESKCVCCGKCIEACLYGAVSVSREGKLERVRSLCNICRTYECIGACYHEAIGLSAKYYSVDDLMRVFQRDRHFWGSRGGVTFSGGEPLMQREFMTAMLKRCKEGYIHTCIETTSCLDTDYFLGIMQYVEWAFTDIKHMDPQVHRKITGVDNKLILHNIRRLVEADWGGFIVPRIPVVPAINDTDENIRATAQFVRSCGLELINILPFHRLGESKYRQLGQCYQLADQASPAAEQMNHLKKIIEDEGLYCFVGWETPF
jgi:glycyl-radical enzyme activating protein